MDQNESSKHAQFLHQNCRVTWPEWTCVTANVCGLFSTAVWFIVLLPQVWKNFLRKSERGLSVLWATANFTASLINLFFVFMYASIPLYGQISSVYSPVLEFALLIQFWVYGNYRRTEKFAYLAGLRRTAINVVILNMKLRSTSGQSTGSVAIAMVGKTTDFISNNGLVIPLHYVIMAYFSTSVAYINGIQVAWYFGKEANEPTATSTYPRNMKRRTQLDSASITSDTISAKVDNAYGKDDTNTVASAAHAHANEKMSRAPGPLVGILRWACIVMLGILLAGCIVGFSLNVESYFGLFAPVSIVAILAITQSYLTGCRAASFTLRQDSIN